MPLINTTAEFKQYLEVSAALKPETMLPSVRIAERRFIAPLLGPVYATLNTAYTTAAQNASSITDNDMKALALLVQEALANLSMVLIVPRLVVMVSDAGIRRNEGESTKSAYQYQEQNLQESYANAGFDTLEDVLALLELNPNGVFTAWQTSDAATTEHKYFIQSAAAFNNYYPIFRSRQTYLAVKYIMQRLENFHLLGIIGQPLFADLKTNPASAANKVLLSDYICPALAMLTIAKGLIEKAVTVSEKGVTVSVTAPDRNRPSREPAPISAIEPMAAQLTKDSNEYLSRMVDFLQKNTSSYPLYADQSETSRIYNVNNTRNNSFYGV